VKNALGQNVAFFSELASGRFLIVGVELPRGGPAISEDVVCFRAYRAQGDRFTFVATSEFLHSSDPNNDALTSLQAQRLPAPTLEREAWFLAWAMVPPRSPYTVAMRLLAFDGETFRTLWAPKDVVSTSVADTVSVLPSGLTVNALFAADGNAAHATELLHQQYLLTIDGPQQIAEWRTPNR